MKYILIISLSFIILASCKGNVHNKSIHIEQQTQDSIRMERERAERFEKERLEKEKREREEKERNASKWQYYSEIDPMTDNLSYTAKLSSNEKHNIDGKDNGMDIIIRYNKKDDCTTILLGLDNGGKIRQYMPLLESRFDKKEVIIGSYLSFAPNVANVAAYVGTERPYGKEDWLTNLKNSNTLAIKIELENGSTATYTFDTKNFKWEYNTKKPNN